MKKRKVLILGAGACQVPLIEKCRAMNCEVLAVSIPGPYPGLELADKAYHLDVRDREAILQVGRTEQVDAVLTDQTDIPVATAAWVAARLGLPGIGEDCSRRFTNKRLMREACLELGIPVPTHAGVTRPEAAAEAAESIGYPVMVKPVDNQGSRGVTVVRESCRLADAFTEALRFSAAQEVLVEEFFEGREIVIEGLALDRQFRNLVIGDRRYFTLPDRFIPQATLFPSTLNSACRERLLEMNTRLVTGMGLPFGITHSEFLVNESTGDIRLVETAARGGGVLISSHLIPLACGIDANDILLRCALGEPVSLPSRKHDEQASGYVTFHLPAGTVETPPNADTLRRLPGVDSVFLDGLSPGTTVADIRDKTMRQGPIIIAAPDRAGLDALHATVRETLTVTVRTPRGIRGPIWE